MKQKIILLSFALLYTCLLFSQVTNSEKDSDLYRQLIIEMGVDKDIPIFYRTNLKPLKRINIKDSSLKWISKDTVERTGTFLNQININSLEENDLLNKIGTHPFTRKMYEVVNSRPQPFLALSPIVYSNDKKLALCSVYHWSSNEASSETVYLLRYGANKWQIVKFLVVSIS